MWVNDGTWDRDSTDLRVCPYVDAWARFVSYFKYRSIGGETPICSHAMRIACMPDDWGMVEGDLWLVERKSGTMPPLVGLQLAGQAHMLEESLHLTPVRLVAVRLSDTGEYKPFYFRREEWHQRYLSAVNVWHMLHDFGLIA